MKGFVLRLAPAVLAFLSGSSALAEWVSIGPYGGNAQIVAVDPGNPRVLLAGTRTALLYRSGDGAGHWAPLPFPVVYGASIYSVAIDPADSSVYYVGVADDAPQRTDDSPAGVYRSGDAGLHWERAADLRGRSVYSLALWPGDSCTIAAGTEQGVWRSEDAGAHWTQVSDPANREMQGIVSLAFDPADSRVIYAGTPHLPWKTADGGATWKPIHRGMIDDSDVFSIRVDAAQPGRVFASACSGIYSSADGGDSWHKVQGIPGTDRRTHAIAQDPVHPEFLYAGTTVGLWRSSDGGANWRKLSNDSINSMAVDPADSGVLYVATEGSGILKSTDRGQTFHSANEGFVNRAITAFSVRWPAGDAPPPMYASSAYDGESGGLFRGGGAEKSWRLLASHSRLLGENVVSFAVSPANPDRILAATFGGFIQSSDGGKTWRRLAGAIEASAPLRVRGRARRAAGPLADARGSVTLRARRAVKQPFPPRGVRLYALEASGAGAAAVVWAATGRGLYAGSFEGRRWRRVKISPSHSEVVYSIFASPGGADSLAVWTASGLYVTGDGGHAWRKAVLPGNPAVFYSAALGPAGSGLLMAATSSGLFRSHDGGASWTPSANGLPSGWINSVAFHPCHPGEVYAVRFGVVFVSHDSGDTWQLFDSKGLESVWVRSLAIGPGDSARMFALSGKEGIFAHNGNQETASSK